MERYDVYLHNVPVVKDEKVVPIEPHRTLEFSDLEEARKCAAEHKDGYARVVVMRTADDKQRMIERYIDGEHVVPEEKEEEKEEEEKEGAEEEEEKEEEETDGE